MSAPILFVVNPISGNKDKIPIIRKIWNWSNEEGREIIIWKTTGDEDQNKLGALIQSQNFKTVVAVGGDGTMKLCGEVLKDSDINLGLIPAGSANGMARELEIPFNPVQALDVIATEHCKRIDLLQFNGNLLGMHISDIGLNAFMVKKYQHSGFRGFLGYATSLMQKIRELEPFQATVKTPEKEYNIEALMIAIANAKRYGTGALLNAKGKLDDGKFELCILKDFDVIDIGKHFFDRITEDSPHMDIIQAEEVLIEIQTDAKIPFQIDGEPIKDIKQLKVKMLPQCLNVILPH